MFVQSIYFLVNIKIILIFKGKPDIVVSEDEEFKRIDFDKFKKLNTVFQVNFYIINLNYLYSTCSYIVVLNIFSNIFVR